MWFRNPFDACWFTALIFQGCWQSLVRLHRGLPELPQWSSLSKLWGGPSWESFFFYLSQQGNAKKLETAMSEVLRSLSDLEEGAKETQEKGQKEQREEAWQFWTLSVLNWVSDMVLCLKSLQEIQLPVCKLRRRRRGEMEGEGEEGYGRAGRGSKGNRASWNFKEREVLKPFCLPFSSSKSEVLLFPMPGFGHVLLLHGGGGFCFYCFFPPSNQCVKGFCSG